MFFRPPLSLTRSYDSVFEGCSNLSTLHHRFIHCYNEFNKDVNTCLALYNSYVHRRLAVLGERRNTEKKNAHVFDGNSFRLDNVISFLDRINNYCRKNISSVFTEFKSYTELWTNHPKQGVSVIHWWSRIGIRRSLDPVVWNTRREAEAGKGSGSNRVKINGIFCELLCMAKQSNHRRLKHWAVI